MDFKKQADRHARNVRDVGMPVFAGIGLLAIVLGLSGLAPAWLFALLLIAAAPAGLAAPFLYARFARLVCPECGMVGLEMRADTDRPTSYICSACGFAHQTEIVSRPGYDPESFEL